MKSKKTLLSITLLLIVCVACVFTVFAHSGRTDENGGHWNRSSGEYHYHHGYAAHDHPNGICPYAKKTLDEPNAEQENVKQETEENSILDGILKGAFWFALFFLLLLLLGALKDLFNKRH